MRTKTLLSLAVAVVVALTFLTGCSNKQTEELQNRLDVARGELNIAQETMAMMATNAVQLELTNATVKKHLTNEIAIGADNLAEAQAKRKLAEERWIASEAKGVEIEKQLVRVEVKLSQVENKYTLTEAAKQVAESKLGEAQARLGQAEAKADRAKAAQKAADGELAKVKAKLAKVESLAKAQVPASTSQPCHTHILKVFCPIIEGISLGTKVALVVDPSDPQKALEVTPGVPPPVIPDRITGIPVPLEPFKIKKGDGFVTVWGTRILPLPTS